MTPENIITSYQLKPANIFSLQDKSTTSNVQVKRPKIVIQIFTKKIPELHNQTSTLGKSHGWTSQRSFFLEPKLRNSTNHQLCSCSNNSTAPARRAHISHYATEMSTLYFCTILLAFLACLSLEVNASAVKGYPHEPVKVGYIKEAEKSVKLAAPVNPISAPVPVLESSRRVYNDESIRRLSQQPSIVAEAPVVAEAGKPVPVVLPVVAQSVQAPVVGDVPVQGASVVAPVVVPIAAPIEAPKEQAAAVEPVASVPVVPAAVVPEAVVVPKSDIPMKQADDVLPVHSERSAPIRAEQPIPSAPIVPIVEQPIVAPVAKVAEQPAPVVAAQPSVVQSEPAYKPIAQIQPEPVVPLVQAAPIQPVEDKKVVDSVLQAKKDEIAAPVQGEPSPIEVPAPDPQLALSEPIDSATKLLIDLDEHVQKFLPAEDQQQAGQHPKDPVLVPGVDFSPPSSVNSPVEPSGKSSAPLMPYSLSVPDDSIVPPLPVLDSVEKNHGSSGSAQAAPPSPSQSQAGSGSGSQISSPSAPRQGNNQNQNQQQVITQLMDQLDSLQHRIQDTINQLVARRRYVMSALLRPMGTYVRRVRTNLERLQNRVNQLQAAASSVGNGQNRPGGFVDAAAIETIRRRIDDISKRISDIVNRIRFSLTPTSAPMNSNGK